jgi:formylglycine-generating enzyme required for sulfatase activity
MKKLFTITILMLASTLMAANPEVTNVSFQQTQDGTGTVLISYDVSDADGDILDITLNASSNGGLTWDVQCDSLVGAVGEGITAGTNKMIFWFAGNDYPETYINNLVFRILADDNFGPGAPDGYVTLQTDSFIMGSPPAEPGSDWNERPEHNVNINRYIFMSQTEVTQESWLTIMGSSPSANAGCDSCPVEQVSWNDAIEYCNALSISEGLDPAYIIDGQEITWSQTANGYFLPTEAIWEYACRASTTTAFANGEISDLNCADPVLDLIGWYCGNAENLTHQIATKSENSWNLFDMHGNVSEWCWDYYEYGYYTNSPEDDPTGPETGTARVIRGGSYSDVARMSRSASRNSALPETVSPTTGLRVCKWAEDGPAGTAYIQIDAEPDELNAPWIVTAPNGEEIPGNGDQTLTVSLMGEYTISWLDVEEWNTPSSESQILIYGESITFLGEYTQGIFNYIGIYTDLENEINHIITTYPFEAVELYVLLVNPTYTGASGYEFQIITEGSITAPAWQLEGAQPRNVFAAPVFAVGLGEGELAIYPNEYDACHLLTYSAFVMVAGDIVNFYIEPIQLSSWTPPNIGYSDALTGNLKKCVPSSGAFDISVFSINGEGKHRLQ